MSLYFWVQEKKSTNWIIVDSSEFVINREKYKPNSIKVPSPNDCIMIESLKDWIRDLTEE